MHPSSLTYFALLHGVGEVRQRLSDNVLNPIIRSRGLTCQVQVKPWVSSFGLWVGLDLAIGFFLSQAVQAS